MGLKELDLHVTNKCVLRCRHCVFSSGERQLPEMSFEKISQLIDDFSFITARKGTINLFGGEALLRGDIFDIIDKAKKEGLSVGVTTNCHVSEDLIEKLLEKRIDRLTSDLDGVTPEMHDWLRNTNGNFNEVVKTLKKSLAKNIYTTVNSVLHKDNIDQVIPILELCKSIGVDGLAFYYLTPTGRGVNLADKIIDSDKWLKTKNIVLNWIKKNQPKFKVCWEEAFENINDHPTAPWRCEKGHSETIFIRCDGEVYSCALLEYAPVSLGNITKEKLGKVLERRKDKSFLRSNGCPALIFNKYRDLSKQDPRECSESVRLGCPYNYQILNGE
jgi:radical SAM protein with 4Fe4S-binding SPASM domain